MRELSRRTYEAGEALPAVVPHSGGPITFMSRCEVVEWEDRVEVVQLEEDKQVLQIEPGKTATVGNGAVRVIFTLKRRLEPKEPVYTYQEYLDYLRADKAYSVLAK